MHLSRKALGYLLPVTAVFGIIAACSDPESTPTPTTGNDSAVAVSDSGSSSGDANVGPLTKETFCAAFDARERRCRDAGFGTCKPQLVECLRNVLVPAAANSALECFSNRACSVNDDSCVGALVSESDRQGFVKSCLAKRATCNADGGAFVSDDSCFIPMASLTPSVASSYAACIDKPCADIRGCFDATFAAAGCSGT